MYCYGGAEGGEKDTISININIYSLPMCIAVIGSGGEREVTTAVDKYHIIPTDCIVAHWGRTRPMNEENSLERVS